MRGRGADDAGHDVLDRVGQHAGVGGGAQPAESENDGRCRHGGTRSESGAAQRHDLGGRWVAARRCPTRTQRRRKRRWSGCRVVDGRQGDHDPLFDVQALASRRRASPGRAGHGPVEREHRRLVGQLDPTRGAGQPGQDLAEAGAEALLRLLRQSADRLRAAAHGHADGVVPEQTDVSKQQDLGFVTGKGTQRGEGRAEARRGLRLDDVAASGLRAARGPGLAGKRGVDAQAGQQGPVLPMIHLGGVRPRRGEQPGAPLVLAAGEGGESAQDSHPALAGDILGVRRADDGEVARHGGVRVTPQAHESLRAALLRSTEHVGKSPTDHLASMDGTVRGSLVLSVNPGPGPCPLSQARGGGQPKCAHPQPPWVRRSGQPGGTASAECQGLGCSR